MPTRRQFLVSSSAACAFAALPKALLAERIGGDPFANGYLGAYTQGLLTMGNFQAVVGSTFKAFLDDDTVAYLQLLAVTSTGPQPASASPPRSGPIVSSLLRGPVNAQPAVDSFYAQFSMGSQQVAQGTYVLDHGTLGRFSVFLVPGNPALSTAGTCSATFNYLSTTTPVNNPGPIMSHPILKAPSPVSLEPIPAAASSGVVQTPSSMEAPTSLRSRSLAASVE